MSTPAYAQPFSNFAERSIVIAVTPTMDKGRLRMLPSSAEAERALESLSEELMSFAPVDLSRARQAQWVSERLDTLLGRGFSEDAWFGSLPENRMVILVKDSAMQAYGPDRALRRVHGTAVVEAARSGISIPSDVAAEYQAELKALHSPSPVAA